MIYNKIQYKKCWITVNRDCNIACKWCYAKNIDKNEICRMPLTSAKKIVDMCKELGITSVVLIGGEPTLYQPLTDLISYCKYLNINTTLITNGIKLSDEIYCRELIHAGLTGVNLSLKGNDKENFEVVAGKDYFEKVLQGIENINKNNLSNSVSMVITNENINTFLDGIRAAKSAGAKFFTLSYCYNFNVCGEKDYLTKNNIRALIDGFVENYEELDKITEGKFSFSQSLPLCLWDEAFIKKLETKGQISSVCQLLKRAGLIFDTEGNLIPCNAMHQLKLGKLGKDFNSAKELLEYIDNKEINNVYDKLCAVPDKLCLECEKYANCGGGCVTQWTNYNFDEIKNI